MNKGSRLALGLLTFMIGLAAVSAYRADTPAMNPYQQVAKVGVYEREYTDGRYTTIKDEQGQTIDMMARVVYRDDEFIAADNTRYRVERVEGLTAYARKVGRENLAWSDDAVAALAKPVQAKAGKAIGIYHTHSAESYVPTDGSDSIPGNGGILKVGKSLAEKLKNVGTNVQLSLNAHDPHDSDAYRRSRRTAVGLLQKGAGVLVDVHRDGIPDASYYEREIANQDVTQMRLVVGRENQNMSANLDFAKRIKAYADKKYPRLVKAIFLGAGDYNQDLSPRSTLIEMGTHTNKREEAQRGVKLFADVIPAVAGVSTGTQGPGGGAGATGDWKGVLWVLAVILLGGGAFLIVSSGGMGQALARLRRFTSVEWANFLGRIPRPSRKPGRDEARRRAEADLDRDDWDPHRRE